MSDNYNDDQFEHEQGPADEVPEGEVPKGEVPEDDEDALSPSDKKHRLKRFVLDKQLDYYTKILEKGGDKFTKKLASTRALKLIQEAQEYKSLRSKVDILKQALVKSASEEAAKVSTDVATKKAATSAGTATGGAGAGYVVFWVVLIAIALILLCFIFYSIFGKKPDELKDFIGPEAYSEMDFSGNFGLNADQIYGVRAIYTDDEKAEQDLFSEYATYFKQAVASVELTNDGYVLEISLLFPEDVNELKSDETYLATLQELEKVITKVYMYDNKLEDEAATSSLTLSEKLQGINYFGVDANIKDMLSSAVLDVVSNNVVAKDLSAQTMDITPEITEKIQTEIEGYFASLDEVRTEKAYFFSLVVDADHGVSLPSHNYTKLMYYVKGDFIINLFNASLSKVDTEKFVIHCFNGDKEVEIFLFEETEGSDLYEPSEEEKNMTMYETEADCGLRPIKCEPEFELKNEEKSTFAVYNEIKGAGLPAFMEAKEDENGFSYYAFNLTNSKFYFTFEYDEAFTFTEFDVEVE